MSKHTPGPWDYFTRQDIYGENISIIQSVEGYRIAEEIVEEADARLIATAPELLEACKIALEAVENPANWNIKARIALTTVIAKAEGRKE